MQYTLPSNNVDSLKALIDRKIINVSRRLLESDLYLENHEQMADGPTELTFDNNKVISFFSWTEIGSIGITHEKIEKEGKYSVYKNLTNNSFWKQRVGQKITKIIIYQSIFATKENALEFGIEFEFENQMKVSIEYLDEENFPDTLRIVEKNEETRCTRIVLSN